MLLLFYCFLLISISLSFLRQQVPTSTFFHMFMRYMFFQIKCPMVFVIAHNALIFPMGNIINININWIIVANNTSQFGDYKN
jgi:hypothetical protein